MKLRSVLSVAAIGANLCSIALFASGARAQCASGQPCDVGLWAGPWEWNSDVCASYTCVAPVQAVEFYHGALIPRGRYAGDVLLMRTYTDPNCGTVPFPQRRLESWLFRPDAPTELLLISSSGPGGATVIPANMACAAESWDRNGRLILAGGFALNREVFRFNPNNLGSIVLPWVDGYQLPGGGESCSTNVIAWKANTAGPWTQIGDMFIPRYYATVIPMLRPSLQSPGQCTNGYGGANLVLGGPPSRTDNEGSEVLEILDPTGTAWSCPVLPVGYPQSFHGLPYPAPALKEDYTRHSDPAGFPPTPMMDSYPRAFQLSASTGRQVFVAGHTRTDPGQSPAYDPNYASTPVPNGRETWTMKLPYGGSGPSAWQLWRSPELTPERIYGNSVLLHTRDSFGSLTPDRVLTIAGVASLPTAAVQEYDAQGNAAASSAQWIDKTSLLSPRVYSNSVVLPDGTILVVGGNRIDHDHPTACTPVGDPEFRPELYDPQAGPSNLGTTRYMAASNAVSSSSWPVPFSVNGGVSPLPRLYHSMAMLLPDASVFVVGGRIFNNNQATWTPPTSCPALPSPPYYPDSRLSGEIFYPPYLFDGNQFTDRPTIDGLVLSNVSYQALSPGQNALTFPVDVTTISGTIGKVVLARPAAVTHHFDSDQRHIELLFTGGSLPGQAQQLTIEAPSDDIAPPWLLHVVRAGGAHRRTARALRRAVHSTAVGPSVRCVSEAHPASRDAPWFFGRESCALRARRPRRRLDQGA